MCPNHPPPPTPVLPSSHVHLPSLIWHPLPPSLFGPHFHLPYLAPTSTFLSLAPTSTLPLLAPSPTSLIWQALDEPRDDSTTRLIAAAFGRFTELPEVQVSVGHAGAVASLVHLSKTHDPETQRHAARALGNLAGNARCAAAGIERAVARTGGAGDMMGAEGGMQGTLGGGDAGTGASFLSSYEGRPAKPCTPLHPFVPRCTPLYPCAPLCTPVHPCAPLCTPVHPCAPLCTPVHPRATPLLAHKTSSLTPACFLSPPRCQRQIGEQGGVRPLIKSGYSRNVELQQLVVRALANLALDPSLNQLIESEGGTQLLVRKLASTHSPASAGIEPEPRISSRRTRDPHQLASNHKPEPHVAGHPHLPNLAGHPRPLQAA